MPFGPLFHRLKNHPQLAVWLLLAVSIPWACFRLGRSLHILFGASHDGFTYYSLWFVLSYREFADIALRQSLYLPHTWFVLTPFFMFGWPVARVLLLILNIASVLFIGWRLASLARLDGPRRCLLLSLFLGWLSTGLVIGLGNLALVCVAALVAAFPFDSQKRGIPLALSAMKQSLVFPIYFHLLLRRPLLLLIPAIVFSVTGLGVLAWARMSPMEGVKVLEAWSANVSTWTAVDHTCLRRILGPFLGTSKLMALANWTIWFGLFAVAWRHIKDPLAHFAALLLLSLLPMYHHVYDMVAAAPVLAVALRHGTWLWPTLLSVLLAANPLPFLLKYTPKGVVTNIVEYLDSAYYPLLILAMLAGLVAIDHSNRKASPDLPLEAPSHPEIHSRPA